MLWFIAVDKNGGWLSGEGCRWQILGRRLVGLITDGSKLNFVNFKWMSDTY